jgi:hypothetical protein
MLVADSTAPPSESHPAKRRFSPPSMAAHAVL